MTVSHKAAFSLLVSVILAAGFSVLAFTGFFNLVETRFYNPSITRSLETEVARDSDTIQDFLDELRDRFSVALSADAVKRSFLPNQAAQDIFERTRVYGLLLESQKGLQTVRFVDTGGLRLHFSTSTADILNRSAEIISYRNYEETLPYVPYPDLAVPSGGNPKITLDQQNERIIFSFPFYDSMEVYRGTALYSLSVRAVADRLIAEGRIKIGENLSIVTEPPGMVSGLPHVLSDADAIVPVVSSIWKEGILSPTALDSNTSGSAVVLISAKTGQGLFVGRVADETLFAFPQSMKVILVTAIFLTLFLSIFLAFNLKPDNITVVQNRLKNLQLSLIREYYERKGEMDWNHWYRELEQRREDVRTELKRGVKEKPGLIEDIDNLIDKSWDEILTAIGGKRETRLAIDEDKLQSIISRMLMAAGDGSGTSAALVPFVKPVTPGITPITETSDIAEEVLQELDDDIEVLGTEEGEELVEDLEDLEDAEVLSDVDELDEAEEITELEEEPDTVDAAAGFSVADDVSGYTEKPGEDDFEDLEELEELEPTANAPVAFGDDPDIASTIEFGSTETPEDDSDAGTEPDDKFVIISPFSSMLSGFDEEKDFNNDDDAENKVKTSGRMDELDADFSMSLVYTPFQNEDNNEPQELPSVDAGVIKHKNGINYVDKKAKKPDTKTSKSLDPGLKNLVDSVISKKK